MKLITIAMRRFNKNLQQTTHLIRNRKITFNFKKNRLLRRTTKTTRKIIKYTNSLKVIMRIINFRSKKSKEIIIDFFFKLLIKCVFY